MHPPDAGPVPDTATQPPPGRWWGAELSGYQWFVLVVAMLAWLFDTMDQQLFNLARRPAVRDLLPNDPFGLQIDGDVAGGLATMIFMIGWATGGIIFGIMGDRVGRARTMLLTVVVYSAFTGLSALSVSLWDFAFYRFLTGLGVGGEFAVGVSLVAEVMHDRVRSTALGWLQASSAIGNCMAALIGMGLAGVAVNGAVFGLASWRFMFVVGTLPALLVVFVMGQLREPERWKAAAADPATAKPRGSLKELFGVPELRRRAIVGLLLGFSGVVGLWGIGFFSFDLIGKTFTNTFVAEIAEPEREKLFQGVTAGKVKKVEESLKETPQMPGGDRKRMLDEAAAELDPKEKQAALATAVSSRVGLWVGIASLLQNAGGFLGVLAFTWVTARIGRRQAFAIAFLLSMASTAATFALLRTTTDVFWLIPILGFCQLTVFGGFAIYFPELFPTRLRSTGTSFCYNVGRYLAAVGPLTLGLLSGVVFKDYGKEDPTMPLRYAGVTMCAFFLVGLAALPFAPETKGKPLPE